MAGRRRMSIACGLATGWPFKAMDGRVKPDHDVENK
jgi:hypothetical protein